MSNFIIVLFLLGTNVVFAQGQKKLIRQGVKLMEDGFYFKALSKFNSIFDQDSSSAEVNLYSAICYLELHEPNHALKLISKISGADDCVNYYKSICYLNLEKFNEASYWLQQVEEISCYHQLTKTELEQMIESASNNYLKSKGYLVRSFGAQINSKDRDFCAVMLNKFDSVLFTSRRQENLEILAEDGMGYESIYQTSINRDQTWSDPVKLDLDIEAKRIHYATAQVLKGGKKLILFRNGDLHVAEKEGEKWVLRDRLHAVNTGHNETHCFLTDDQNTIYFSSDFLSDDGNLDLYVTSKTDDGVWSQPRALDELNTPFDEDAPFISEDGTFYFSSRGHNSIGGFDVFSTRYDEATACWDPIENMGYPVNSVADDIYFNTFGKVGYLSSSRLGGEGMLDIYQVLLFNKIKLQGNIVNLNNNIPIPGATVDVAYGDWFLRAYSDYEGNYEMYVPINKGMQISIVKDTLKLHEGNYVVKVSFGLEDDNTYNFTADLDLYEDSGPVMSASMLDRSDTVTINLQVKNDLKKNDLIRDVLESDEREWLDSLNAAYLEKHVYDSLFLKQREERGNVLMDSALAKIHFGFDDFSLQDSVIQMLENCIELLSHTSYDQLEICGYTDAVGSDMYNQVLSIRRAKAVSDFLIEHGVPSEKLIVKGLGEKQLIERQEGESALNRRVELIMRKSAQALNDSQ